MKGYIPESGEEMNLMALESLKTPKDLDIKAPGMKE